MQSSREKRKVFSGTLCPLLFQLASFLCLQKDWKQSIGKLGVLLKRRSGGFSQGLPFLSSYWKHSSNIWVGASLETLTGNSHSIHIFSLIGWLIRKSTICMPANFPPPMLCPPPREQFPFFCKINDESELSHNRVEQFGIFSSISPVQPPHYSTLHQRQANTRTQEPLFDFHCFRQQGHNCFIEPPRCLPLLWFGNNPDKDLRGFQKTSFNCFWILETIKGGFLSFQKHFWFVLQKFSDCRCDKVAKVQPMKTFFLKFVWKGSAPTHNKKQNKWIIFSCFVDKIFSCGIT